MTPYLGPGCPEELLITKNMLGEAKRKGQGGQAADPNHDSPPIRAGVPHHSICPGKDSGSSTCACRPLHLSITQPGFCCSTGRGDHCQPSEHNVLQLRIRGHLRILLLRAGSTVAEPFPADICPIYFQNPPTAILGNLFLCFATES